MPRHYQAYTRRLEKLYFQYVSLSSLLHFPCFSLHSRWTGVPGLYLHTDLIDARGIFKSKPINPADHGRLYCNPEVTQAPEGGGGPLIDIECPAYVRCRWGILIRTTSNTPFNYLYNCKRVCHCQDVPREGSREEYGKWSFLRGIGKGQATKENVQKGNIGNVRIGRESNRREPSEREHVSKSKSGEGSMKQR